MSDSIEQWVLVKAAYEGAGLFGSMGETIDYTELGLPFELYMRIDRWLGWFDDEFGSPEFEELSFSQEGFSIATAVKAEIPEWTVEYYDVATESQYEIVVDEEDVEGEVSSD